MYHPRVEKSMFTYVRFITFRGRSAHLAHQVPKIGCNTLIITIIYLIHTFYMKFTLFLNPIKYLFHHRMMIY